MMTADPSKVSTRAKKRGMPQLGMMQQAPGQGEGDVVRSNCRNFKQFDRLENTWCHFAAPDGKTHSWACVRAWSCVRAWDVELNSRRSLKNLQDSAARKLLCGGGMAWAPGEGGGGGSRNGLPCRALCFV